MKIALTGGTHSGKSTIASALEAQGFQRIVFTDILKQEAVAALNACHLDSQYTLKEIQDGKEYYRPFLQNLGSLIGFDWRPFYLDMALAQWDGKRDIVFDNVRTLAQWEYLVPRGFTLVELRVSEAVRRMRAARLGVPTHLFTQAAAHPIEQGIGEVEGKIVLDGTLSIETIVRTILNAGGREVAGAGEHRVRA